MALSFEDLTMGREKLYGDEFTEEISDNLEELLLFMQLFEAGLEVSFEVASGWRPPALNGRVHGAKKSLHQYGLACDISDRDGKLRQKCLGNLGLAQKLGIYFEDFRWTRGWVHMQIRPPRSRKRIFIPYADQTAYPMNAAEAWDGSYDPQFDGDLS